MSHVAIAPWCLAALGLAEASRMRVGRRRQSEAVARACHEVRGPLTSVGLALSAAAPGGGLAADRLRAIETELGRAALAIHDLDDARRGRRSAWAWDAVEVEGLLDDALRIHEPWARRAGVRLTGGWSGPGVLIRGDRLRLAQALGNLVSNAIEHGGGSVRVLGAATSAGGARIEVGDEGPGLSAPLATIVRRPRAGRGRRGRGLAIAAAIARSHDGRLETAPTGRGALLALCLPGLPAGVARSA